MRHSIRRQLRFLRVYAVVNSIVLIVLATAAFRQAGAQKFDRITAQRIDIVDADGTLRMVISNKDRMHPGSMDGKTLDRPRPVAGMIFFSDEGDEIGGLTFSGREAGGSRVADSSLMFDQLKQDQTIGFSYREGNGRRTAGFQVWDRADSHLSEVFDQISAANKNANPAEREAALAKIAAAMPPGPRRVFVGKTNDRAATVSLADAKGKPRLTLTVNPDGNPRIEFLDEQGKVVARLPNR